jgi:hypothetical protein
MGDEGWDQEGGKSYVDVSGGEEEGLQLQQHDLHGDQQQDSRQMPWELTHTRSSYGVISHMTVLATFLKMVHGNLPEHAP